MKRKLLINGDLVEVNNLKVDQNKIEFNLGDEFFSFNTMTSNGQFKIKDKTSTISPFICAYGETKFVTLGHDQFKIEKAAQGASSEGPVSLDYKSPMPGKIFKLLVKVGQHVKKGDDLIILEAMKMEHSIKATSEGIIDKIYYGVGDQVEGGKELLKFKDE